MSNLKLSSFDLSQELEAYWVQKVSINCKLIVK